MKKNFLITLLFVCSAGIVFLGNPAFAAEKGKYGGALRVNIEMPSGVIGDPLHVKGYNHLFVDSTLQTLIQSSTEEYGAFKPVLAESWEVAKDRSSVTFNLRKGVKFHDGTDCNAQAVKWNLDRWVGSAGVRLSAVKSIDIIDDYTIKCNLSSPDATILYDFSKEAYAISPTAFEENGQDWAKYHPVGTGAFKFIKSKRNVAIEYEKFNEYWEEGLPYLDKVTIPMIEDRMTQMASLKSGEVDVLFGVDNILGDQIKNDAKYKVSVFPFKHEVLAFNSEDPTSVWSDKRMRLALEYAIDKAGFSQAITKGFFAPTYEIVHSINEVAKTGTVPREFDLAKAKSLIKEAGYGKGLKVKFTYPVADQSKKGFFLTLQENMKELGIELVPDPAQMVVIRELELSPIAPNDLRFDAIGGGVSMLLPSIKNFHSTSIRYKSVARPKGFDGLIENSLQSMDPKEQLNNMIAMEKLAYDDVMFVPVYTDSQIIVHGPELHDSNWFYADSPAVFLERAWLDK